MPAENETNDGIPARTGVDRRTLIKGAAIAGAAAWTAPILIDSIASPAAAGTGALAFQAVGANVALFGSGTLSPLAPARIVGDFLLCIVVITDDGAAVATPAGYTLRGTAANAGHGLRVRVFSRTATNTTADNAGMAVTSSGSYTSGRICSYRTTPTNGPSYDIAAPVVQTLASAASANTTPTGVTTVHAAARAVSIVAYGDNGGTLALATNPGGGWAIQFQQVGATFFGEHKVGLADTSVATAGAQTFPQWNDGAGNSDFWCWFSDAIQK